MDYKLISVDLMVYKVVNVMNLMSVMNKWCDECNEWIYKVWR